MTQIVTGHCHCGAITICVPQAPEQILQCNCSMCCANGFLGSYFDPATVTITGGEHGDPYVWGDRTITIWHCRHCGTTTHWTPLPGTAPDRMGVNIRMFAPEIWNALPVQFVDGRSF